MLPYPMFNLLLLWVVVVYALHLIERSSLMPQPRFALQGAIIAVALALVATLAQRII